MKKEWSLYIYAAGRNELEAEIWRQITELFNFVELNKLSEKINLFIEVGRAEKKLPEIIRKKEKFKTIINDWSGVKRFTLAGNNIEIYENRRECNMADPAELQDFLQTGLREFPGKNNILVLSGHGYQFVGMMTDYCQDRPYIMGFPELSKIINKSCKNTKMPLDIIFLDSCYCNYIEIIYEFTYDYKQYVKNMLTFNESFLQGFSFIELVELMMGNKDISTKLFIKKLIENSSGDLRAYKINKNSLKKIKLVFNELAEIYQMKCRNCGKNIKEFIENIKTTEKNYRLIKKLYNLLAEISYNDDILTHVAYTLPDTDRGKQLYSRLKFTRMNKWFEVIAGDYKITPILSNKEEKLQPLILDKGAIKENIKAMNPGISELETENIFSELIRYKNWNLRK